MKIIPALRRARIRKRWTQYRLAKEAGLSPQTVANLERGAHDPRLGVIERCLGVMGLRLSVEPTKESKKKAEDEL